MFCSAGIDDVAHDGGPLLHPQAGVHRQAGGEVDNLGAFDGVQGLCRIEQVCAHQLVAVVDLFRMAAHQANFASEVAIQLNGQFATDLSTGTQDGLHINGSLFGK